MQFSGGITAAQFFYTIESDDSAYQASHVVSAAEVLNVKSNADV